MEHVKRGTRRCTRRPVQAPPRQLAWARDWHACWNSAGKESRWSMLWAGQSFAGAGSPWFQTCVCLAGAANSWCNRSLSCLPTRTRPPLSTPRPRPPQSRRPHGGRRCSPFAAAPGRSVSPSLAPCQHVNFMRPTSMPRQYPAPRVTLQFLAAVPIAGTSLLRCRTTCGGAST